MLYVISPWHFSIHVFTWTVSPHIVKRLCCIGIHYVSDQVEDHRLFWRYRLIYRPLRWHSFTKHVFENSSSTSFSWPIQTRSTGNITKHHNREIAYKCSVCTTLSLYQNALIVFEFRRHILSAIRMYHFGLWEMIAWYSRSNAIATFGGGRQIRRYRQNRRWSSTWLLLNKTWRYGRRWNLVNFLFNTSINFMIRIATNVLFCGSVLYIKTLV